MKKIKVLVVDDSAFMRKVISDILSGDPQLEVVGRARNGVEGIEKAKELSPDVITLDVEMPVMNGLDALDRLMKSHPLPVIMLSSLTQEGAAATIRALELGAVDFITKPSGSISLDIHKVAAQIIEKVKAAAGAKINRVSALPKASQLKIQTETKSSTKRFRYSDNSKNNSNLTTSIDPLSNIIVVGTSTGGPKALQILLTSLPADLPAAILVVQHMPPGFTKSLSQRLDALCSIRVVEAEEGMPVQMGVAYIAPGDFHMEVKKHGEQLCIALNKTEARAGHRPSVDILFQSVSAMEHPRKYAVVMTGMGSDGTKGIEVLKNTGCKEVIAEDESTCVVYGMPKSAILSGNVDTVLPLSKIGPHLNKIIRT